MFVLVGCDKGASATAGIPLFLWPNSEAACEIGVPSLRSSDPTNRIYTLRVWVIFRDQPDPGFAESTAVVSGGDFFDAGDD